jgi:dihydrofolate synthase/folylpolyglutamate synthase
MIANEKAGIIKKDTAVIIGEYNNITKKVFEKNASEKGADINFASDYFEARIKDTKEEDFTLYDIYKKNKLYLSGLKCGLKGLYQQNNIITSFQVLESLKLMGIPLNNYHIYSGFENVKPLTGIRGRWEIVSNNPQIICDIAHNAEGLVLVIKQLSNINYSKLHIIIGMVKEKNPESILRLLPKNAIYYFTRAEIPRSMDENSLKEISTNIGLKGSTFPNVGLAFSDARKNADENDIIYVGGSTYIVSDFLNESGY